MPSNKKRDLLIKQAQDKQTMIEQTGNLSLIYKTVALMPVLDDLGVNYKVVEICFTADKKLVSMEEIDRCRTQGTALNKLENAFNETAYNILQLRRTVKALRKEQENE